MLLFLPKRQGLQCKFLWRTIFRCGLTQAATVGKLIDLTKKKINCCIFLSLYKSINQSGKCNFTIKNYEKQCVELSFKFQRQAIKQTFRCATKMYLKSHHCKIDKMYENDECDQIPTCLKFVFVRERQCTLMNTLN